YTTTLPKVKIDSVAQNTFEISIPNIDYVLPMEIVVQDSTRRMDLSKKPVKIISASEPMIDPQKWYLKGYYIKNEN
ncbi:MAG: hypothetical protein P8Y99_07445, partial [Calditrichaceae bacterium]